MEHIVHSKSSQPIRQLCPKNTPKMFPLNKSFLTELFLYKKDTGDHVLTYKNR